MIDEWDSCYNLNWKGIITPESFSHPAKFSHALIRRIYQHLLSEGMIKRGDTILDPFGGVGLGGLYAAQNGLKWIGCELEPKFVALGQQNIELWQRKFAPGFPRWVTPQLIQGDSRWLTEVIGQAMAVIASPPYANGEKGHPSLGSVNKDDWGNEGTNIAGRRGLDGNYGQANGQLASMSEGNISAIISSPPFAGNSGGRGEASRNGIDAALFDRHSGGMKRGTGETEGNLDHMPMGDVKAIISSPPFADSIGSDDPAKRGGLYRDPKRAGDVNLTGSYGDTPGQLGGMKPGAVVASPPYEGSIINSGGNGGIDWKKAGRPDRAKPSPNRISPGVDGGLSYGQTPGQLGTDSGETFWSAAKTILDQCALILPPGAPAIWVTKRYIKDGKIVDFSQQWAQLCEACEFELVHVHRAMLVKNRGLKQTAMDGEDVSKEIKRASFFRLLAERKGSPKIDYESVLCFRRK